MLQFYKKCYDLNTFIKTNLRGTNEQIMILFLGFTRPFMQLGRNLIYNPPEFTVSFVFSANINLYPPALPVTQFLKA